MKQELCDDLVSQKTLLTEINSELKKRLDDIETDFPFVSDCDINAVKDLYDGKEMSDVSCGPQKSL